MMIAKHRLDGLTDGVFGVAMTLLIIDLRLPENFHPHSAAELLQALAQLDSQFIAYAISFFVLGLRWIGTTRLVAHSNEVSDAFARWSLLHLFLITCVPFSTMLIGRHDDLAPSVLIYAANMALAALVSLRLVALSGAADEAKRDQRLRLGLLIFSALISAAISVVSPSNAMWAYLLNALRQPIGMLLPERKQK